MTSLYNRATLSQAMLLRIVEGAIKNTCDAHPELEIDPRHRRSIAKRAAGTLSAQWTEVLAAAPAPSESDDGLTDERRRRRSSQHLKATGRGVSQGHRGFPLRRLIAEIARPLKEMKREGYSDAVHERIEVLKIIDRLRRQAAATPSSACRRSSGSPSHSPHP